MNNHESTRMDTNPERLLFKNEVFQIVGCAIEVLNALATESLRSPTKMHWSWSLGYGRFHLSSSPHSTFSTKASESAPFPDLIVFNSIVVDAKVIDRITDHERGLMLNYLRITALRVGAILNFKHRKLEWERTVL